MLHTIKNFDTLHRHHRLELPRPLPYSKANIWRILEAAMSIHIRVATVEDAAGVLAIYRPIVEQTVISFEFEPPTHEEMERRIATTLPNYPWLVCEQDGEILGYVYGSRHSERAAYQWSANVSVYVAAAARRRGIGRALYTSLFELLRLQGIYNVYAGITLPNEGSVGIHEAVGMRPVGVYEQVGFKMGAWHDVGWWQMSLREHAGAPQPLIPFRDLPRDEAWHAALAAGTPLLP
jgi:L-amino acid N-acyltransferase YncA